MVVLAKAFYAEPLFWTIAGVVVAVIAVVVAVVLYVRGRQKRVIAYRTTTTDLIHGRAAATGLEVSLNGERVERVTLVELLIFNSGNAPIRPQDFETPIRVNIAKGEVLDVEVAATTPNDLDPSIPGFAVDDGAGFEVAPLLLNAKDGFVLRVLVSEFGGDVTVGGRIAGASFTSTTISQTERLVNVIADAASTSIAGTLVSSFLGVGGLSGGRRSSS